MILATRAAVASAAGFAVAIAVLHSAFANDSSVGLSTGGLVFVQNPSVQMRSEQLFVSTAQIRVTYHFFDNRDQPVTNLVAFPMPDITFNLKNEFGGSAAADENISIPTDDPVNFLAFTTTAGGKAVATQVEQKVFAKGIEQAALLRQLGIPLAPQLKATWDALDALPPDKWQQLIDLGLADTEEHGIRTGVKQDLYPLWTLKTTYYWQQTFPAHEELVITHQYKPSVGVSLGSGVSNSQYATPADYQAKYCMNPAFLAAAARAQRAATRVNKLLNEKRIDYILTTGSNWAGPIKDFTLTIDKGDPANLISFCGDGVKKIAPTQFQVHYTNFIPKTDLAILILTTSTDAIP